MKLFTTNILVSWSVLPCVDAMTQMNLFQASSSSPQVVLPSPNKPAVTHFLLCIGKRVLHLILYWRPSILLHICDIPSCVNETIRHFHCCIHYFVPWGSPSSTSGHVSRKLQCKQLWKIFLQTFYLLKCLDFCKNLTLWKFGTKQYLSISKLLQC